MDSQKIAFFAAAAALTFAGAAFAQSATAMPTPGQQTPQAASPAADQALPATTTTATPPAQASADTSAAPASATVAGDFKVGTEVKDPAGVSVGTISGVSAAADGSVNLVVTNGGVKFALPSASLSSNAGALTTTATKAQIDATLAGAKPQ
ncbi:hypothetical protein ACN2C7_05115 [Caulobacter sp. ErkDOM-E]|uniref:hypothetical protein n=1 Tax=Caulobacter sp. ErkDOM-E TaxID=3402778 RepID=UPI003AF5F50F